MPRISGVEIPDNKQILFALTAIFGIGRSLSADILLKLKIDSTQKTKELKPAEISTLRTEIEQHRVEGDLRREVFGNIKRLKDIGSYRGSRHTKHLPVRGQNTKSNSRTVRGNVRRTIGSGRRPAASPT